MRKPPMVEQGDSNPEFVPPSRADAVFQHLSALVAAMNAENTGEHAENEILNELRALRAEVVAIREQMRAQVKAGSVMNVSPAASVQTLAERAARSTSAAPLSADRIAQSLAHVKAPLPLPQEVLQKTALPSLDCLQASRPAQ